MPGDRLYVFDVWLPGMKIGQHAIRNKSGFTLAMQMEPRSSIFQAGSKPVGHLARDLDSDEVKLRLREAALKTVAGPDPEGSALKLEIEGGKSEWKTRACRTPSDRSIAGLKELEHRSSGQQINGRWTNVSGDSQRQRYSLRML